MIVDDEEDIRESFSDVLKKQGYQITTASNADECIKKLETVKPDLILMDIMMPGTPITEYLPKIRNTKILFITVVKMDIAEKEGFLNYDTVVDYIEKPCDIKILIKKVEKIIGKPEVQ